MKTLALFLAAGLTLALSAPSLAVGESRPALAQPLYRIKPAERNAALKYWEAAANMSPDLATKIGEANLDEAGTTPETAKKCPSYQAAVKAAEGFSTGLWIHASQYAKCDFEVRYEEGIMAMLPHLGKLRSGARYLRFEARHLLIEGKPDEAAEQLAAMIRIANHSCADGFLISSLVGNAIASLALGEIKLQAETGRMTEQGRAVIRKALDEIDEKDPMRLRASLVGEQTLMLEWIKNTFTAHDAGKRLAESVFSATQSDDPLSQVRRTLIEKLDEQGLAKEMEQTRSAYEAMLVAWDAEDPIKACEAVSERFTKHEFGPLAAELCPAVSKARSAGLKFETTLKECRETLDNATLADVAPQE